MSALSRLTLAMLVLLGALATDGAAGAAPAFADHECEVQGYVIPCSDPGITAPDQCSFVHYHGTIRGNVVPDSNPACGLGLVIGPFLHQTTEETAFAARVLATILERARPNRLVEVDSMPFRFANDVSGRPTIGIPGATVDNAGAFPVQFGAVPDLLAPPGGIPCNQPGDDLLFLCAPGTAIVRDGPYMFFVAEHDGPVHFDDPLDANISFPVLPMGGTPWQVQGPFVGDTWQGASVVPQIVFDGPTGNLTISRLQGNAFMDGPCTGCIGIIEGPHVGLLVPNTTLVPGGNLSGLQWGYAVHVHDGTFGQCPSCRSTITAFPPVPRQPGDLLDFDAGGLITFGDGPSARTTATRTS